MTWQNDDAPGIDARSPGLRALAPPGTRQFAIRFDRPMDTSRGRCRLSWGRPRFHDLRRELPLLAWSVADPELRWDRTGSVLALTLPEPLFDGFRVRVEWSDLRSAVGHRVRTYPRDEGLSYVVSVGAQPSGPPQPPSFSIHPRPDSGLLRRDVILELYPHRPLSPYDADAFEVRADGSRVPVRLTTNRNPPDWIYLHLDELLPPDSAIEVVARADLLQTTRGASAAADQVWRFQTTTEPPPAAVPDPRWSEPTDGLTGVPIDRFEGALRFHGRPILRDLQAMQSRVQLLQDGRPLPGIRLDMDPTPAHYRAFFIHSTPEFPGLRPGAEVQLQWRDPSPFGPSTPGQLTVRAAAAGDPPTVLVPCPHLMCVATDEGSLLQVVAEVYGEARAAWVEEGSVRYPLVCGTIQHFRFGVDTEAGVAPPQVWAPEQRVLRLPPVDSPRNREFTLVVQDTIGRERRFPGLAFDMTASAFQEIRISGSPRPTVSWTVGAPMDSVYLSLFDQRGLAVYGALLGPEVTEHTLASDVRLAPGTYRLDLWASRATPEDDLWDHALVEREVFIDSP